MLFPAISIILFNVIDNSRSLFVYNYVVNVYNICFLNLYYTPNGVIIFENKLLSFALALSQ